ncbi:MAG TPA: membrane protein insertase YidC [Candidatus Binataceae bacterium]|nr:membrane protein insertase YidC [Candidatus Binataceae bacterium]
MDNNRLLISIIVVLGVLFLYQELLQWRYPNLYGPKSKQSQNGAIKTPEAVPTPVETPPFAGLSPAPARPGEASTNPASVGHAAAVSAGPSQTIKVETDYFEAVLTGDGARLASLRLKKFKQDSSPHSPDYEMVIQGGTRLPMGLLIASRGRLADDNQIIYTTEAPGEVEATAGHPASVTFNGETADGLKLQKTFTFRNSSYVFDITAAIKDDKTGKGDGIGLTMSQPLKELAGYRDYPELQFFVNGKASTEGEKQLRKGVAPLNGSIVYAGFGDRYFLSAFLPVNPNRGSLAMDYAGDEADAQLIFPASANLATQVYMGPKELNVLEAVNPLLSKAIDLGFWGIIALPFLRLLKVFYYIAPNYGVAIILLTILVRLATLPMSIKGQRSMMKMQRLQPQVEKIRERFKDQSDKLHHEMMELYKRNHVNPLGGCLPMAIQFPVFIGLYEALLNAVELRNAPFIGWIRDLSAPDCLPIAGLTIPYTDLHGIPVLVILMTITAFVQQWISPRNPDPSQQKMMMYMPVVFSLIFIELPAGLSLYYFFSNLLGVIQQFILNREFKQYSPVTTT